MALLQFGTGQRATLSSSSKIVEVNVVEVMNPKTANLIALVVTAVWAISFLADIALKSYNGSPYVHAIMMVVAGAAFSGSLVKKNGSKK